MENKSPGEVELTNDFGGNKKRIVETRVPAKETTNELESTEEEKK